ncbi:hypothetical protein HaLaN_04330 [Haematococcus lacustris]|uniref:Uncharacterized protein n=1 Tax=Haematococcus lacustris TaxID=44745 RepID=A0A699YQP4_HAELA|nr:hypothetical protein HaLaN_04330 [Haematococcus lacustris]
MLAVQGCSPHRITIDGEWAATYVLALPTDPTEATAPAIWWERLKAAPAYNVEKAKELCTSGKLKELAYSDLDAFVTLLDTGERYLPPPGKPQC